MATQERIIEIIALIDRAYYDDGGFEGINRLLGTVVVRDLDIEEMIAFIRTSFIGSDQMPNHAILLKSIWDELRERGETEDRIKRLLIGFQYPNAQNLTT